MCNCCRHRCFELQEIVTSAAQVNLPDDTRIRTNKLKSLYVQPSDPAGSLTYLTPLGRTIATWSVLNSSYLYAYNQNGTRIATLPLAQLIRTTESPEPFAIDWQQVDPQQSFIKINTGAAGYAATHAIVLVWEIDCNECAVSPNNV